MIQRLKSYEVKVKVGDRLLNRVQILQNTSFMYVSSIVKIGRRHGQPRWCFFRTCWDLWMS
uniref:Uncharacterized protein n=1 Tax=Arion vulgaris TaxID=1028688 RepID=A0A0B6XW27_9EUPU